MHESTHASKTGVQLGALFVYSGFILNIREGRGAEKAFVKLSKVLIYLPGLH